MLLLSLTVGMLLGTALGLWISPPLPGLGSVALAILLSVLGLIVAWAHRPVRWAGIVLLAAILSGARAQVDRSQLEASMLPSGVEGVRGAVANVPHSVGRASAFVVDVDGALSEGQWTIQAGRIEARTFGWVPAEGDRVEITGEVRPLVDLPGAPRATLLRRQRIAQDIQVERMRLLSVGKPASNHLDPVGLRAWMEDRINTYLDAPQGALLAGLLLGSRSDLSAEVRSQFAQTGTSHIVAVSGFNVVIVSGFVTAATIRLLGARGSAFAAILAIVAYTLIVGAPASAVRAAIMAGGALVARIVGRPTDAISGLLVAGALMALLDPLVLQDLGFQLSMLATGGLILFMPPVSTDRTWRDRIARLIAPPLAAQIATLPLILHTFHSLSLIALVANVFVAPFLPIAMAAGALLIFVSGIDYLAIPVSWMAWLAASSVLEPVRFFAGLPGAWLATGAFPVPAMLGSYLSMAIWIVQRSPELRDSERVRPVLRFVAPVVLVVSLLSVLIPIRSGNELSGELLEFGNLMIASSPSGKTLLVGTDTSPQVLTAAVAERLPFWKRSIDVVILSDDAPAGWRGVRAIAERYQIEILVAPRMSSADQVPQGVSRLVVPTEETHLDLGDDAVIQILPNRSRTVPFSLAYGTTGLTFPNRDAELQSAPYRDGWIVVARDAVAGADSASAPARVHWDRRGARSANDSGVLELAPRSDGRIGFSSDGDELTIRWSGCEGSESACSAVIGGVKRTQ